MGDTAFSPATCAYHLTPMMMISGITALPSPVILLNYTIRIFDGTADEVWPVTVQRVAVVNLGDIRSRLEVHSSFPLNRWKSPPLLPIWGSKERTTTIIGGAPVGSFSTPLSRIHTMCCREVVRCLPWHWAMPVTSSPGGNGAWKRDRAPRRGSGLCCSVTRHNCIRNSDTTDGETTGTRKNGSDHWNKALHVWKCCSHSGHTHIHNQNTHTQRQSRQLLIMQKQNCFVLQSIFFLSCKHSVILINDLQTPKNAASPCTLQAQNMTKHTTASRYDFYPSITWYYHRPCARQHASGRWIIGSMGRKWGRSSTEQNVVAEASARSDISVDINQEHKPFSDHKSVSCVKLNHFLLAVTANRFI